MRRLAERNVTVCWLIVGVLVGLLACVPAQEGLAQAALTAYEILKNMFAYKGKVDFEGERKTILFRDGQERTTKHRVKQKATNMFREETTFPPEAAGELIVSDGVKRWHYRRNSPLVIVDTIPPSEMAEQARRTQLQELQLSNELIRERDEVVAGRNAYVVLVLNRVTRRPSLKVWVDAVKWVELKSQRFDARGDATSTTFFTRINFAPRFSPQDFSPPPSRSLPQQLPANVQRPLWNVPSDRLKSLRWVRMPKASDLPKGWAMQQNATLWPSGDQHVVILHLSKHGVENFSLVQRQVQPGQQALSAKDVAAARQQSRIGPIGYTWRLGSLEFLLLGQRITKEELDALKKAVEKAPKAPQPQKP